MGLTNTDHALFAWQFLRANYFHPQDNAGGEAEAGVACSRRKKIVFQIFQSFQLAAPLLCCLNDVSKGKNLLQSKSEPNEVAPDRAIVLFQREPLILKFKII